MTAVEAEAGCSTAKVWTYSYDLVGNLTEKAQYKVDKTLLEGIEETQNEGSHSSNSADVSNSAVKFKYTTKIFDIVAKIDAIIREKYAYNEDNQLSEATICDGKTTKKVCYTYDEDGNLLTEYSPTDRSQTTYQYTIEDRLEAVYKGNAYNKTLQMAVAYDGDGNRVYQLNYNPEKDEDFSDYYCSYQNCDYNGTGIQLQASGEVSQAEKDLMALIGASGAVRNSSYELIEYINDVNREYMEVLVEQNINGRIIDTVYTCGNERISREMFQQTSRTAYYLYDPRGSISGLTDAKAHLTKTYRYSANGELIYGGAKYENEYTYNGESYNPNIRSQYLRARYYSVTSARFLTEDSYQGDIAEPLTLNRYNYCVSSWLNYQDPSGQFITVVGGFIIGALGGLVISGVDFAISAYETKKNGGEIDWYGGVTGILNTAMSGGVGGAVFGATGNPIMAGAAGGATYGFLSSTSKVIRKGSLDSEAALFIAGETIKDSIVSTGGALAFTCGMVVMEPAGIPMAAKLFAAGVGAGVTSAFTDAGSENP